MIKEALHHAPSILTRKDLRQVSEAYFIPPSLLDSDRMDARHKQAHGVTYTFFEQQQESGLFPLEEETCRELITECKQYLGADEVNNIRLALQFCLFGHQRQWRKSGEPYTYHPLAIAIEAAREYKADWQTVALCLLHDLAEDSEHYGHQVYPAQVKEWYAKRGLEKDGDILAEGMKALKKIEKLEEKENRSSVFETLFSRQKNQAEVDTVQKLYDTILPVGRDDPDTARVILVKLLDRKHNMQTIGSLKREKQIEKATETLHIYVNMAHAFGLYKLRDELFQLAFPIIYPKRAAAFTKYEDFLFPKYERLAEEEIARGGKILLKDFHAKMSFKIPSWYDFYRVQREEDPFLPFLSRQIIIPEKKEETVNQWRWRAAQCFGEFLEIYSPTVIRDISVRIIVQGKEVEQRHLTALIEVGGVYFRIEMIGEDQHISDTASIQDLFTGEGEGGERQKEFALKRIDRVRSDYEQAKLSGNVSSFFEAVQGGKVIYNEQKNPLYFPPEATLLDVLYTTRGDDAFRVAAVIIKGIDGKRKEIRLHQFRQPSFDIVLQPGDQIEKVLFFDQVINSSSPLWRLTSYLRCASFHSVRELLAERIKGELETSILDIERRTILETGEEIIREKYKMAWDKQGDTFIEIPASLLPVDAVASHYPSYSDFLIAVGLDIADEEVFESFIEALIRVRKEVLYMEITIPQEYECGKNDGLFVQVSSLFEKIGIECLERRIAGRNIKVWFHTGQLGSNEEEINTTYDRLCDVINTAFEVQIAPGIIKGAHILGQVPSGWMKKFLTLPSASSIIPQQFYKL